jgi:hypothetical protein
LPSEEENFEQILLGAIDDALMNLGESCRAILYTYLAAALSLKKDQIPGNLEEFTVALRDIFKQGEKVIDELILETLCEKLGYNYKDIRDKNFTDAVQQIRETARNP